jgi:thiosulfate dehydrogenase (quinone) large subunit
MISSTRRTRRIAPSDHRAIAVVRIGVGVLFLIFGEYKVFGTQFTLGGGFAGWITRFIATHSAYPFMVPVLQSFVLPYGTAIAFLVAYGELAIGVGLVTGILVRTASVCGAIYMVALLFSSNYPGAQAPLWQYFGASLDHSVLALCFASLALSEPPGVLFARQFARDSFLNELDASGLRNLRRLGARTPERQRSVSRPERDR